MPHALRVWSRDAGQPHNTEHIPAGVCVWGGCAVSRGAPLLFWECSAAAGGGAALCLASGASAFGALLRPGPELGLKGGSAGRLLGSRFPAISHPSAASCFAAGHMRRVCR